MSQVLLSSHEYLSFLEWHYYESCNGCTNISLIQQSLNCCVLYFSVSSKTLQLFTSRSSRLICIVIGYKVIQFCTASIMTIILLLPVAFISSGYGLSVPVYPILFNSLNDRISLILYCTIVRCHD